MSTLSRSFGLSIFTTINSGITQLEQLRGRSLALGAPESAIGDYLPKCAMVRAGLRSSDLTVMNLTDSRMFSAVVNGQFDAGVAYLDEFVAMTNNAARTNTANTGVALRVVQTLQAPAYCWVATGKLDESVARALSDSFLALRSAEVLAKIDHELTRFVPAVPGDYDALEKQMEQARLFSAPPSKAKPQKP